MGLTEGDLLNTVSIELMTFDVPGDRVAFVAGVISGLNITKHLIRFGIVRIPPYIRAAIAEYGDLVSTRDSLRLVNRWVFTEAHLMPSLYYREDMRRGIYGRAYSLGIHCGMKFVLDAYNYFVLKGCTNKAVSIVLPKFIERHKNNLTQLNLEDTNA